MIARLWTMGGGQGIGSIDPRTLSQASVNVTPSEFQKYSVSTTTPEQRAQNRAMMGQTPYSNNPGDIDLPNTTGTIDPRLRGLMNAR